MKNRCRHPSDCKNMRPASTRWFSRMRRPWCNRMRVWCSQSVRQLITTIWNDILILSTDWSKDLASLLAAHKQWKNEGVQCPSQWNHLTLLPQVMTWSNRCATAAVSCTKPPWMARKRRLSQRGVTLLESSDTITQSLSSERCSSKSSRHRKTMRTRTKKIWTESMERRQSWRMDSGKSNL